jgi:hypothetical protein
MVPQIPDPYRKMQVGGAQAHVTSPRPAFIPVAGVLWIILGSFLLFAVILLLVNLQSATFAIRPGRGLWALLMGVMIAPFLVVGVTLLPWVATSMASGGRNRLAGRSHYLGGRSGFCHHRGGARRPVAVGNSWAALLRPISAALSPLLPPLVPRLGGSV